VHVGNSWDHSWIQHNKTNTEINTHIDCQPVIGPPTLIVPTEAVLSYFLSIKSTESNIMGVLIPGVLQFLAPLSG